jgi:hypothetical protein
MRIRFLLAISLFLASSAARAEETCEVTLRAVDLDTGRGIAGAVFGEECTGAEYWWKEVGKTDKDGYLRLQVKAVRFRNAYDGFCYSVMPLPDGYQTAGINEVALAKPSGGHVSHTFYFRRPTLKPAAERPPLTSADLARVPALQSRGNDVRHFVTVNDMPGFAGKKVNLIVYPGEGGHTAQDQRELAARVYRDGEWVAAAVRDELRYFQKAEPQDKGEIDAMRDIEIEFHPAWKTGKHFWRLHCHLPDELPPGGYYFHFQMLDSCHLRIADYLQNGLFFDADGRARRAN